MKMYTKDEVEEILKFDNAVFQFNQKALFDRYTRRAVIKLINQDYPVVFGSDFHNLDIRASRWDKARSVLKSKLGAHWLEQHDKFCMDLIAV
jgi:protein-tyrosine phosphatase